MHQIFISIISLTFTSTFPQLFTWSMAPCDMHVGITLIFCCYSRKTCPGISRALKPPWSNTRKTSGDTDIYTLQANSGRFLQQMYLEGREKTTHHWNKWIYKLQAKSGPLWSSSLASSITQAKRFPRTYFYLNKSVYFLKLSSLNFKIFKVHNKLWSIVQ